MNRILKRSICLFIVLFAFVAGIKLYYTSLAVSGGECYLEQRVHVVFVLRRCSAVLGALGMHSGDQSGIAD